MRVQPLFTVHDSDDHEAVSKLRRRLDRGFQALFDSRLDDQPIDYNFNRVIAPPVQHDLFIEAAQDAVDACPQKALAQQFLQVLLVFAFAPTHHRSQNHDSVVLPQCDDLLQYLLGRLARDFMAALRAVRNADRRIQHAHVVVNLGDGPDSGTRTTRGCLLFNRDCRAQAVDRIDIGPFHLIQELPRVRRQRFDVAPLPLGVDRVEGERRLPGTAQTRDHSQGIARNLHVDILQIVMTRPMDGDAVQHSEDR